MDKQEIEKKINEEEDYIKAPKFFNSINRLLAKRPNGVEDKMIARILMLTEEKVKEIFETSVEFLKRNVKDN